MTVQFFIFSITAVIWLSMVLCREDFCGQQLALLFDDCSAFDDSKHFGGLVCGSDGATYPNWLYLRCINHRNSTASSGIHVNYKGPCTEWGQSCPYSPLYKPICATDEKTYANMETLACVVTKSADANSVGILYEDQCEWDQHDPCVRTNWELWGHNPVCGSNGLTYPNVDQIRCLQNIHPDLSVLHDGGCSVQEALKTAAQSKSDACWLARNRYEWNPICGNNNITYPNPFILLCYQPEVAALFQGECGSPTQLSCLKANDAQLVFDPQQMICGSNGVTYQSEDHLQCATVEDKYLWSQHSGPCATEDDPCDHKEWPASDVAGSPVCASDGNTYISPNAIWCAQRTYDPCVKFLHDGPCIPTKQTEPYQESNCNSTVECEKVMKSVPVLLPQPVLQNGPHSP